MRLIGCLLLAMLLCLEGGCTVRPASRVIQPGDTSATSLAEDDREDGTIPGPSFSGSGELQVESQAWHFHGVEGHALLTPNFKIHTTLRSRRMLTALPRFYEECLGLYTTEFGELPAPRKRMEAFVFRDARQWRNKTRELLPEQADAFMTLGRGGFTTRGTSVLYYIGRRDTFAIAAHEGWHQYTQSTFNHAVPVWLEEGIATYVEAVTRGRDGRTRLRPWDNEERRDALINAVREGELIPMDELLSRTPQSFLSTGKNRLLIYYAQVWALSRFLMEGEGGKYRPALHEVLRDAADGKLVGRLMKSRVKGTRRGRAPLASRSGPAVLLEYFNPDLSVFHTEYDEFVRRLTGSRGPHRATAGLPEAVANRP